MTIFTLHKIDNSYKMKHFFILTLTSIFFFDSGFCQTPNNNSVFKISKTYLSEKSYTAFVNRTFGQLATGQNTSSLSNFGSFDPTKGAFDFNAFTPLSFAEKETSKLVPYLSLNVKGDLASDNVTKLFSNSKLNTNINANISIHFPLKIFNSISYYGTENKNLLFQKVKLQGEFDLRLLERDTTFKADTIKRNQLWALIDLQDTLIQQAIDSSILYQDTVTIEKAKPNPDVRAIARLSNQIQNVIKKEFLFRREKLRLKSEAVIIDSILGMNRALRINHINRIKRDLKAEFADTLTKLELNAPLTGARLSWFSVTGNFNRKKYYEYDTLQPFLDRLSKVQFNRFNLNVEWHLYIESNRRKIAHHLVLGYSRRQNNNIDDLSTSDLTQKIKSSVNGTEREVLQKYSVYTDNIIEYKSDLIYADYYFMFKKSALSAIHLFPEYDQRNNGKKILNLGIGYIISLKDSKKEKSIINAEAYYKFLDLRNDLENESGIWERNEIGVRVGFPLQFVLNNK